MYRAIRAFNIVAAAMAGIASAAHAQQSSFSIAPPPIAAPSFEDGKTDGKVRFTYIDMSGNGMEFTGGGVDGIARKAFSNRFAWDGQAGCETHPGRAAHQRLDFLYSAPAPGLRIGSSQ